MPTNLLARETLPAWILETGATHTRNRIKMGRLTAKVRISLLQLAGYGLLGPIRSVSDPSHLHALQRFRYHVYIEQLGKSRPWANHECRLLPDPDDGAAFHFLAGRHLDRPVGCVRLHLAAAMPTHALQSMGIYDIAASDGFRGAYISMLMLDHTLRGRGAALFLMLRLLQFGWPRGMEYALFHCAPRLAPRYLRYGFECLGDPFQSRYSGWQVPMISLFGDCEAHRRRGSLVTPYLDPYQLPAARISELRRMYKIPAPGGNAAAPQSERILHRRGESASANQLVGECLHELARREIDL